MHEEVRETHQARACLGGECGKFGCMQCFGSRTEETCGLLQVGQRRGNLMTDCSAGRDGQTRLGR